MTRPILQVEDLVKHYGGVEAVNGVSFAIEPGVCFGLLGPNGAGKTTALEAIEDIIAPTSGRILYDGRPRTASFREEVGIQFQHTALLGFMSVRETLATFRDLYSRPESLDYLVDICRLEEILDQRNDRISGGQAQRLMLALALVNRPRLVFLDEPSTGLDPQARRYLWEIIRTIREGGRTIVLTTHSMDEAEYLCDEIAIMDHGRIIAQGSPAALIRQYCPGSTISLPQDKITEDVLEKIPCPHRRVNGRVEITADLNTTIGTLIELGVDLSDMSVHSPDLEDVFLHLTGRKLRD